MKSKEIFLLVITVLVPRIACYSSPVLGRARSLSLLETAWWCPTSSVFWTAKRYATFAEIPDHYFERLYQLHFHTDWLFIKKFVESFFMAHRKGHMKLPFFENFPLWLTEKREWECNNFCRVLLRYYEFHCTLVMEIASSVFPFYWAGSLC